MSAHKGFFLTFEGIDGSGKSTHAALAAEWLGKLGLAVCHTMEPGGTPLGRQLRQVLLETPALPGLDLMSELMLYLADRAQHLAQVIRPALQAGMIVVCERYNDSTLAYQACGRGLPWDRVQECCRLAAPEQPDLTVLLELDPALALERLGATRDRLEAEGLELLTRVATGYRGLPQQQPARFLVVDSSPCQAEVFARLQEGLIPRLRQAGLLEGR
jgi:dTMP kinase